MRVLVTGGAGALVFAGLAIGCPVAVLVMRGWLDRFSEHVRIGPGLFLLVAAISMLAAFLTVAWQCVRAARTDPVRCLRYE